MVCVLACKMSRWIPIKILATEGCHFTLAHLISLKHRTEDAEHIYSTAHSPNCFIPNLKPALTNAVNSHEATFRCTDSAAGGPVSPV